MRNELANLNHCTAVNLCWYYYTYTGSGTSYYTIRITFNPYLSSPSVTYTVAAHIKQQKRQSDCIGGELSPQPHINNIGLCVHYMIYRIKLINNSVIVIQSNNNNNNTEHGTSSASR